MTSPLAQTSDTALSQDEKLHLAVQAYRDNPKQTINGLATRFGINKSTLQNHLAGAWSHAEEKGDQRRLSMAETAVIAMHVVCMQKLYFLLTPANVVCEAE